MRTSESQHTAPEVQFQVLVIEDDELDFAILERQLKGVQLYTLHWAKSMREGLSQLSTTDFDVILLDLTLPDSKGLDTVEAFTERTPTPVVVVSGTDDEDVALKAVQQGAQDYLVKGQYSKDLIVKTLRYALERSRLLEELARSRELIQRERELRRLESDAPQPLAPMGGTSDSPTLEDRQPALHDFAVAEYARLLERAVERRGFKTSFNPASPIRELAGKLGASQATPRDVVAIHTHALDANRTPMKMDKRQLRNEEARYLLTGLMGHLCAHYLALSQHPVDSTPSWHDQLQPEASQLLSQDH